MAVSRLMRCRQGRVTDVIPFLKSGFQDDRGTTRRSGYTLDDINRTAFFLAQSHLPAVHCRGPLIVCKSSRVFVHGLFANKMVPLLEY
jgi:hypothetical protein